MTCTVPDNSGAGSVDVNHPTASTLDLSAIRTGSVSPTGFLQSTTRQTCTTDDFGFPKESPTGQWSPPPFMPSKNNSHTPRGQRSASPVPCPSPSLCSTKYASDHPIIRGYRKLDDLVHLRSIRVFEGIKATWLVWHRNLAFLSPSPLVPNRFLWLYFFSAGYICTPSHSFRYISLLF